MNAHDNLVDAVSALVQSEKFLLWEPREKPPQKKRDGVEVSSLMADERHFTPDELAALWGVSAETVRSIFRNESGVLRVANPNEKKRRYVLIRIPESIAQRVHKRLSAAPQ